MPDFRDGDLISASTINELLDNIDYVIGMDEQRQMPYDSGANYVTCTSFGRRYKADQDGQEVEAWIAHNGDQIKILHGALGDGGTTNATLVYDYGGARAQTFSGIAPGSVQTLQLNTAGFSQYEPVRIRITADTVQDDLCVRYLYQTRSTLPSFGGLLPAFTNGATSSAAHFNTVIAQAQAGYDSLAQPVSFYICASEDKGWKIPDGNIIICHMMHRHNTLVLDLTAQHNMAPSHPPYNVLTVYVNSEKVWDHEFRPGQITIDNVIPISLSGLGLSVGDIYKITIHETDGSGSGIFYFKLIALYEEPGVSFGTIASMTRWEHGDTANGSAGDPNFAEMSAALSSLSTNMGLVNVACREHSPYMDDLCAPYSMWSFRVHRWLAYKSGVSWGDQAVQPQIQWYAGNSSRALQSVTLPDAENAAFYDLESTPIQVGMYMKVSGVQFAIQTPLLGGDLA
jgi:hypothetical protein